MWTKTVIRDFLYYTIFPKPCLRSIAFTVKTKSTYHTSPTQATKSKHEATWGTLCTMGMKWCRDVMCQRLVQNSAWRHCSDRLRRPRHFSIFLDWEWRGLPVTKSCYNVPQIIELTQRKENYLRFVLFVFVSCLFVCFLQQTLIGNRVGLWILRETAG